ncbi:flagellin [Natrarchaeobius oligotrophus]|uniref:Flagellin n=2 Tax=Natrarchaeobius TaxID=2501796 RepID=A0A3N6MRP1_NATCH|nr:flagellin [Natrarchaeobius chitinivorans]
MVFIGSILVITLGMGLIDSLESESESEITYAAIDSTEHSLTTAALEGQIQGLNLDDATYRDDGTVHLAWYDASDTNTVYDANVTIDRLGALEYDLDDRTVIQQSGARWERQNGEYRTDQGPNIRYDGDFLQLRLLTLDEDDARSGDPVARPNYDSDLPDRIEAARAEAANRGYNDLAFVVQSEYHDGWVDYLDSELSGHENITVNASESNPVIGDGGPNTVEVVMKNVTDTDAPDFWVKEDHGIVTGEHASENVFVSDSPDPLRFQATIENVGDERQTQDVNLTILDEDGNEVLDVGNETELDGGEETIVNFTIDDHESELEYGVYDYDVETDSDSLDDIGSFYYAKQEAPWLAVTNQTVDGVDASDETDPVNASEELVTLEADVQNVGLDPIEDESIEFVLEFDDEDWEFTDTATVERDRGEKATVSWELNRSELFEGDHTFTVSTADDDAAGHFYVYDARDVGSSEIVLGPDTGVNVTIVGSEMSNSDPHDCTDCETAHVSEKSEGSFVEGDRVGYEWETREGEWNYDATEPEWNDSGGWNSDADPECIDEAWDGSCEEYGFPDSTEFWWDDDGGWDIRWENRQDHNANQWGWDGPIEAGEAPDDEPEFQVDGYEINWVAASADLVTQPVDEDGTAIGEPTRLGDVPWHDTNLNRFDEPRPLYEYSFTTEERVSFMISATSYNHGGSDFCGSYTDRTFTDTYDGAVWDHTECSDDAVLADEDDELVSLSADTETEETNVRVLGEDDVQLPELDPGVERQMSTDELLERPEVDVPVDEDGYLDLGEHEYIFVFEITHHPIQHNSNPSVDRNISPDDYWDEAHETNGDPNFNDMIAHVEISPSGGGLPDLDPSFSGAEGDAASGGTGGSDDPTESGNSSGDNVDVGTDEIIIG